MVRIKTEKKLVQCAGSLFQPLLVRNIEKSAAYMVNFAVRVLDRLSSYLQPSELSFAATDEVLADQATALRCGGLE